MLSVVAIVAVAIAAGPLTTAGAHRSPCHAKHACPSDHHTYRWNGLSCTSYAKERLKSDKIVRRVGGRIYWCHR